MQTPLGGTIVDFGSAPLVCRVPPGLTVWSQLNAWRLRVVDAQFLVGCMAPECCAAGSTDCVLCIVAHSTVVQGGYRQEYWCVRRVNTETNGFGGWDVGGEVPKAIISLYRPRPDPCSVVAVRCHLFRRLIRSMTDIVSSLWATY
ncbi:hypothetical protein MRB53_041136 [Persea americana]|nr:hypothetical protein MRB53_041136 [Persea americana]